MEPPPPTTDEGKREVNRMRRFKALSQQIWNATGSLLALLGAAAPFAYGFQAAGQADQTALILIILAVVVVIVGALCYFLAQAMAESRTWRADNAASQRGAAYTILTGLLIGQILALPVSAGLQGFAVYRTLQGADVTARLDSELAERLEVYADSPRAEYVVDEYCNDYVSDNAASASFLDACVQFNQASPPSPDKARKLASGLQQAGEAD